jgi:hypothetical protein
VSAAQVCTATRRAGESALAANHTPMIALESSSRTPSHLGPARFRRVRRGALPAKPNTVRPSAAAAPAPAPQPSASTYRHVVPARAQRLPAPPAVDRPRRRASPRPGRPRHPTQTSCMRRHATGAWSAGTGTASCTAYHTAREIWEPHLPRLGPAFRHRPRHAPARLVRTPGLTGRPAGPGPPRGHLPRGHHPHRTGGLTALAADRPHHASASDSQRVNCAKIGFLAS